MSRTEATQTVFRSLLGSYRVTLWSAGAMATAAVLAAAGLHLGGVTIEQSIWEYAGALSRWLLFVAGLVLTPAVLPLYVTQGITRRTVTAATGLTMALLVGLVASYLAAGLLIEQGLFALGGRDYEFGTGHLFQAPSQVHLVLAEYALAIGGYLVSGWLTGSAYYRYGALRGTLLLPLTILPAVAVENVLGTGQWIGLGPPTLGIPGSGLPVAAGLPLAAAAVGLALLVQYTLTRSLPIRTRR